MFFLIDGAIHLSFLISGYIYTVRSEKSFKKIVEKFTLRCLLLLLFISAIESLFYAFRFSIFFFGILFIIGIDIIIFANIIMTLLIYRTLIDAFGTRRNFHLSIGMFYVAIKIRDIYIFAFPQIRKKLVILYEDKFEQSKPPISRVLGRYIKTKRKKQKRINGIQLEIIEGAITFFSPRKNTWLRYVGKIPILTI